MDQDWISIYAMHCCLVGLIEQLDSLLGDQLVNVIADMASQVYKLQDRVYRQDIIEKSFNKKFMSKGIPQKNTRIKEKEKRHNRARQDSIMHYQGKKGIDKTYTPKKRDSQPEL